MQPRKLNSPPQRERVASGTITVVQERRFQLVDGCGVAHLFQLAHDAACDPRALSELAASGERVQVVWHESEEPVLARVATACERLSERSPNE